MANSDYSQTGLGAFATFVKLDKMLDREDTEFTYTEFNFSRIDAIEVGVAGMIGEEIVRVEAVGVRTFTVKRGCADTIPAEHPVGELCWLFSDATGTDAKEYAAGMTIGVKVSPFTTGGGTYPIQQVVPDSVTFNWRFFRPYPPAQMKVNNARWYLGTAVTEAQPNLLLSWVHRDRILQANKLLGQDDPTIGPEPGATYTMRVYDAGGVLLRTEVGLNGTQFNYQWPQIVNDFGYPNAIRSGYVEFTSTRELLDGWQSYHCPFTVDPAGTLTSQHMDFATAQIESPYRENLMNGRAAEGNFVIGVAARPTDRMSDSFRYVTLDDGTPDAISKYTPWLTSEFRLPELEQTFNIRASSFNDGVVVDFSNIGKLALIDAEIVQIDAIGDSTLTLRRGCLDTVPAVHLPGARLWLFEQAAGSDTTARAADALISAKFQPLVYGPDVPLSDLPTVNQGIFQRSVRPYPPAQIVINGRPWFEEAAADSGGAVYFSWARRNRLSQGTDIYDHTLEDVIPEVGQLTRLTFFYTTPSAAPGQPAVVHVLRTIDLTGTAYAYTYDLALIDGEAAGIATGVCGTVVISVKIESIRAGITSGQNYIAALRLPSYPCAG